MPLGTKVMRRESRNNPERSQNTEAGIPLLWLLKLVSLPYTVFQSKHPTVALPVGALFT